MDEFISDSVIEKLLNICDIIDSQSDIFSKKINYYDEYPDNLNEYTTEIYCAVEDCNIFFRLRPHERASSYSTCVDTIGRLNININNYEYDYPEYLTFIIDTNTLDTFFTYFIDKTLDNFSKQSYNLLYRYLDEPMTILLLLKHCNSIINLKKLNLDVDYYTDSTYYYDDMCRYEIINDELNEYLESHKIVTFLDMSSIIRDILLVKNTLKFVD